jgi:hypothetical protein
VSRHIFRIRLVTASRFHGPPPIFGHKLVFGGKLTIVGLFCCCHIEELIKVDKPTGKTGKKRNDAHRGQNLETIWWWWGGD